MCKLEQQLGQTYTTKYLYLFTKKRKLIVQRLVEESWLLAPASPEWAAAAPSRGHFPVHAAHAAAAPLL